MAQFLVMRKEGLCIGNNAPQMKSSFFPVLIQGDEYEDHEVLVRRAFSQRGWDSYNPVGKQYYVFKIADQGIAQVSFKPKVNYDVESVPVEFFGVEYDR